MLWGTANGDEIQQQELIRICFMVPICGETWSYNELSQILSRSYQKSSSSTVWLRIPEFFFIDGLLSMYVLNQVCFRSGQCNLPEKMLRLDSYTYFNRSLVNATHHSSYQYLPSIHSLRVFRVRCYLSQCFFQEFLFNLSGVLLLLLMFPWAFT